MGMETMADDILRYDRMMEDALRTVVREALIQVARRGLPGDHHFFITFKTTFPGVDMAPSLRARYPDEMTIVLQHQFWGLEVGENDFSVALSFGGVRQALLIPFAAMVSFADPAAKFGLQFHTDTPRGSVGAAPAAVTPTSPAERKSAPAATATPLPARKAPASAPNPGETPPAAPPPVDGEGSGKVVTLDAFRKK